MRITCPDCNAAYDVPQEKLAPGRGVKCARCSNTWVPIATEDAVPAIAPVPEPVPPPSIAAAPVAASLPAVTPDPEPPIPADVAPPLPEPSVEPPPVGFAPGSVAVRRRGPPVLVGWLLSAVILLVAAWLGYARRADIVHAWPPSARIYAALRLAP